MSRFFIKKVALPVVIIIMSTGSLSANLNCMEQPSCSELGYSTSEVTDCEQYIKCPFDQAYKACVKIAAAEEPIDCTGYTYDVCPNTARSCTACGTGTQVKYKISSCNSGYDLTGGACVAASCEGYRLSTCPAHATCLGCLSGSSSKFKIAMCDEGYSPVKLFDAETGEAYISNCPANACLDYNLTSCPSGATCSTCKSGETTKYKLTGCSGGFVLKDGVCYDCMSMTTKLRNATGQRGYYLSCDNRDCKTSTSECAAGLGWYSWNDPCVCNLIGMKYCLLSSTPIPIIPSGDGSTDNRNYCSKSAYKSCLAAKDALDNMVTTHNSICTASNYKVTKNSHYSFSCNLYITKDNISAYFCQGYE